MRASRLAATGVLVVTSVIALLPLTASHAAAGSTSVTKSKTVSRVYLENGKKKVIDKRSVRVTVADTQDLRSLQQVNVTWSGAHETNGVSNDVNSDAAQNEEYSFDLLECRGVDSMKVAPKDRISPESCWTEFSDERFQYNYDKYPAWRSDLYATPAERKAIVDAVPVRKQPLLCKQLLAGTEAQRWVPFDGATGTDYPGGPHGCAGEAPEATPQNYSSLTLPSNETFGVTDAAGDGHASFDIFTAEDHASLGCSQTVKCSLVAIPIEGVSCDVAGAKLPAAERPSGGNLADATANCESTGNFTPGEQLGNIEESGDPAVDGTLWWSPSNWRNRISFPLTFAEPDNICDVVSSQAPEDIYGSELMTQATTQWAPHFCLNSKLFDLEHVQTPEPEARTLLASGGINAAFTADSPTGGYPRHTVNAPVAVTGFGIAADIDGANGQPMTHVNLDPRLLAKLLTESYPDIEAVKVGYPTAGGATLSNNPLNITQDPEFQALNPGAPILGAGADGASMLLTVGNGSDVVSAITSYINNDPAARAWLNGKPDPWGMRVNPNYKGIKLPVDTWPVLDTYQPTSIYKIGLNDCLYANPVPYLPQVASPTASLFSIGQDMQFAIDQSQTTCDLPSPEPGNLAGAKLVAQGRQTPGHRFMLGTVTLGDARREGLTLASLQADVSPSASTKFTNADGRTFVAPTLASLRAAADLLKPDPATGTWPIPYPKFSTDTTTKPYPGTMVVYAAVPTTGLAKSDAHDLAEFLHFAASAGQVPGVGVGDLASGFLPMTAANGLGVLASYTQRAADAVAAQNNALPSLTSDGAHPSPTPTLTPSPSTSQTPPAVPSSTPSEPAVTSVGSSSPAAAPSVASSPPTIAPSTTPEALGLTQAFGAGPGRDLVAVLALVMIVGAGGAGLLKVFGPRRPR